MSALGRVMLAVAAILLLAWAAKGGVDRIYLQRRAKLEADIVAAQQRVETYRSALDEAPRVVDELQAFADRTLGEDLETVDHRLRMRLNRIAEQLRLENVAVGTGGASTRESPARSTFRGPFRPMRDEVDLVEVEAWVGGEGTLEQALRLVDVVQSEPWIKRITQVKLDGRDNGNRVTVSVRLTTLFLPGLRPGVQSAPSYDPAAFNRYAAIVARNPFQVPPKPAPAPTPPAPVASVKPRVRYDNWAVTGVATGPQGAEVWLTHAKSGASRRLTVGGQVEQAVLVAVDGDRATFELADERFQVDVGETLGAAGAASK